MNIAQNPLFTSLRKSFTNVTAFTLNGQNIIRAKAFKPKNPKTVAQKANRDNFKLLANTFQTFGQYTELLVPKEITQNQVSFVYASEAVGRNFEAL